MGAKVEKPIQWMTTNVAGIAIPAYDIAGSPMGELPSYINTVGWVMAGTVAVRLAALLWLVAARRNEEEMA
jgi:hypothetical protein